MNTVSRKQRQMELEKHENPSKTSTPLHTTDWYVKWVATVVLIIGMILTANNVHPINLFVNEQLKKENLQKKRFMLT